ncbi:hypothetical protein SRHO_G00223710 [Serrasalmus rhombeus]
MAVSFSRLVEMFGNWYILQDGCTRQRSQQRFSPKQMGQIQVTVGVWATTCHQAVLHVGQGLTHQASSADGQLSTSGILIRPNNLSYSSSERPSKPMLQMQRMVYADWDPRPDLFAGGGCDRAARLQTAVRFLVRQQMLVRTQTGHPRTPRPTTHTHSGSNRERLEHRPDQHRAKL